MSRLLSQAEVDALLASFGSDESDLPSADAIPYDLRAPLLLAGARLSLVQTACERIAGEIADGLDAILVADRPIRAEFIRIDQHPAGTVLSTLVLGEPLGLLIDGAGEPVGALSFQGELALAVVDRLQGGEGSLAGSRPLSAVETRLFEEALHRLARRLDARSALAPVRSGGLDRDPLAGRLAQRGGMLATAEFRIELAGAETACHLLMTPALTARLLDEAPQPSSRPAPPELIDAMRQVPVAVEPVITGAGLRVADLRRMRPGDVLQLDVAEHEELGLRLNGLLLAQGVLRRHETTRLLEIRQLAAARPGA